MIIFLLSLIGPRFALGAVWLFTGYIDRTFDSALVPILGFLFFPWTTLVYALSHGGGEMSGFEWFFVALAFFADVSSYGLAARRR